MRPGDTNRDAEARGRAAYRAGRYDEALGIAAELLATDTRSIAGRRLRALVELARGAPGDALETLRPALEDAPGDMELQNAAGLALQGLRRYDEAETRFRWCAEVYPQSPAPWILLADLHRATSDPAARRRALEAVLEHAPAPVPRPATLIQLHEQAGDHERAESRCAQLLALQPGHPIALAARARRALDAGDPQAALAAVEGEFRPGAHGAYQDNAVYGAIGDALDRLGRPEEAFAAYRKGNEAARKLAEATHGAPGAVYGARRAAEVRRYFERRDGFAAPADDRDADTAPAPAPVFLVGFPRSGTTLLERAIGAHPEITPSDERATLAPVIEEFGADDAGLDRFFGLDEADLARWRERYWTAAGGPPEGGAFLDKLPLHLVWIGLALRLFPGAAVILALRDPRDCVLSAFRQRFRMNASMFQMLRIEDAAAYYDAAMGAGLAGLAAHCAEPCRVRYEDVIADLAGETRRVLDAAGLAWDPRVADFAGQAGAPQASTPSARQLRRPLNADSVGRWRDYAFALEPVRSILDPWAERWGYSRD